MFDLVVAYRVYPGVSKTPAAFPNEKLRLAEMCLRSFRGALGGLRAKVWVLLDGCPAEYESLFREVLHDQQLEILNLNKMGNEGTFGLQLDLLTQHAEADHVFFAEDDYFYLPGALEMMLAFMRENPDADFVTPYDHPDSYDSPSRSKSRRSRSFAGRNWKRASSTCLTFLASRRSLIRSERVFRTYCRGNMDCPVWLALTQKYELANVVSFARNEFWIKTWMKAWYWGYRAILFGRRYRLWTPRPSLATHMESTGLAPGVDWEQMFQQYKREAHI